MGEMVGGTTMRRAPRRRDNAKRLANQKLEVSLHEMPPIRAKEMTTQCTPPRRGYQQPCIGITRVLSLVRSDLLPLSWCMDPTTELNF